MVCFTQANSFNLIEGYLIVERISATMKTTTTYCVRFCTLLNLSFLFLSFSGFSQLTVAFNNPGNYNWTVPCGVTSVTVEVYGAGGGGGGANSLSPAGGGGGAGGYASAVFAVVPGSVIPVQVGAGGAGGNPVNNGANGQQSWWNGGVLFAQGGQGGRCENNGGIGGSGGTASLWTINTPGAPGANGAAGTFWSPPTGGNGGASGGPNGGLGGSGGSAGNNGFPGSNFGGGGGGGGGRIAGVNTFGATGSNGAVVLTFTSSEPLPSGGPDFNSCATPFVMSANAPSGGWTAQWVILSGTPTISNVNDPSATISGIAPGSCAQIEWRFSQAGCPDVGDVVNLCVPSVCNDNCSQAISMLVDGTCINGTNLGATPEGLSPSCFGPGDYNNTVWYSFVATSTDITVNLTQVTLNQFSLAAYDACGGAEIGCIDNNNELPLTGLTPGNTYYVLVDGNGGAIGTFCVSVYTTPPPIGSCENPRTLFVGNDCNNTGPDEQNNFIQGQGNGDNGLPMVTAATIDASCPGNDIGQNAYWVDFNSGNNNTVDFTNFNGSALDYALFTGTCGSLVPVSCYNVPQLTTQAVAVTPNTNYMVMITGSFAANPVTAKLCITGANIYDPPNDDCASALPISSGFNYQLSNSNATPDGAALCSGTTENNIWVYWVAEFTGVAYVNLQNQDCIIDDGMQMSIFTASTNCATLSGCETYINPANNENFFGTFNAVAGNTYYINFDGYAGTGCSFDFCITPNGGANCSALLLLPIELTTFVGNFDGDKIELGWSTANEVNNDYFLIEKSLGGQTWEEFQVVDGAGTTNGVTNYLLSDYDVRTPGTYYYRLIQFDFNGARKGYTPIAVTVKRDAAGGNVVKMINTMGQDVDESYYGIIIYIYEDGSSSKGFNVPVD